MSDELDELELEAQQRSEEIAKAEADLIEQLQQRGLVDLWNRVRTSLHCERFIDSRTGKAVIDRLMKTITGAQIEWLLASDPGSPEVIEAHRRAQAAHMALFAIDEILTDGKEAEADLQRIQLELGE